MRNTEKQNLELNWIDYVLVALVSGGLTCLIYKYLYPLIGYANLKDFYIGTTIYSNHNKYLDIFIVFVYLILFFITYFLSKNFLPRIKFDLTLPEIKFSSKNKTLFFILQLISSFGYIFLHPFNGQIYMPVCLLIIGFIGFSIFHLYKNKDIGFSIFAITPIFILLFGQGYNTGYNVGIDNHHTGEQLTLFFQHQTFNLQYYKDIMLVHGFVDTFPTYLGTLFFGETTLYTSLLGRSLFDNLIVILTVISAYYIFPPIIGFAMFRAYNIPQLYVLGFLLLLNTNPFLGLCLYILLSFLFLFFWTTYGTFWIIASIPFAIYMCFKLSKTPKSILKFGFLLVLLCVLLFLHKDLIYYYIPEAINYIQGNIYNFGNDFPPIKLHQIFSDIIKLFAIFVLPYFMIKLVQEIRLEQKNTKYIFTLIFAIIFTLISLNYSLGRIDNIAMQRIKDISMTCLGVIIPYLLMVKNSKYLNIFKYLSVIFLIIISFSNLSKLSRWLPETHLEKNTLLPSIGEIQFNKNYQENLEDMKTIIDKYSKNDNDFLDLNYGINYFYFNKKMPIPYVSFYNIVNSKQDKKCAEILKENLPNVIVISSDLHNQFDNVYPPQKINAIYKTLLLSGEYSLVKTNHHTFLIKISHRDVKFSEELDKILSLDNLEFMPDVYKNSLKTLSPKNVKIPHKINQNTIIFDKKIKGSNIDFVGITTNNKNLNYTVSINNNTSKLHFKSKQNSVVFPFNNFPSWLSHNEITQIKILTDKPTEIIDVKFYKK